MAVGLQSKGSIPVVVWNFSMLFAVVTLVGWYCLLMWLGEQVTEKGIGNGISF